MPEQEGATRSGLDARGLLRALVLLAAIAEIGAAAYGGYALFVDDTTSWIVALIPDLEAMWRPMLMPSAIAGGIALLLAMSGRALWLALLAVLAGPLISLWLLA